MTLVSLFTLYLKGQHWTVVSMLQPSCSPALVRIPGPILLMEYDLGIDSESPRSPCCLHGSARKGNCASVFPGAAWLTLLFWGREGLYLGIRSVSVSARKSLVLSCQHKVIAKVITACLFPRYSSPLNVLFLFTLQTKLGSCTGIPATFIVHWGLICPLNSLHASLVQLTVKVREVDTEGSIKDLDKTTSAPA